MCARNDSASAATCRLALSLTVAVSTSCIASASWPRRADGATAEDAGAGGATVGRGIVIQRKSSIARRGAITTRAARAPAPRRPARRRGRRRRLPASDERLPTRAGFADREILGVDARRDGGRRRLHVLERQTGVRPLDELRCEFGRADFDEPRHARDRLRFSDRGPDAEKPARATEAARVAH